MIPPFDRAGNLPAGVHLATWADVFATFGSTPHRIQLLQGFKEAAKILRRAGCRLVYLDGSYRSRPTAFGTSRLNPTAIQKLVSHRKKVYPSGITAANLLGFSAQSGRRGEVATSSLSLPRKLIGSGIKIHTRRPEAWATLPEPDVALLDLLRGTESTSGLSPQETIRRVLALLSEKGRFERLLKVVGFEPPRVRAMLGALGEHLEKSAKALQRLKASLNPLSRFDFGVLAALDHAHNWQAKERGSRETSCAG